MMFGNDEATKQTIKLLRILCFIHLQLLPQRVCAIEAAYRCCRAWSFVDAIEADFQILEADFQNLEADF
jgi:hypothetical protein